MSSPQILVSLDPATGERVGTVPVATELDIRDAVARARDAQPDWRAMSLEDRAQLLASAGEQLEQRADDLGVLLTREMGKPLREGVGEVRSCGGNMARFVDEISQALAPENLEDDRTRSTVYHDPYGVCAVITPWNFPLAMPHSLVVPALVAGNAVVLKPSEETPLIAQAYADVLNAFLPRHVLQVVHGADDQGKWLVAADVDLIAFTGSLETGKKIMSSAAVGLKRIILELGGKDPLLVLADADLEAAAEFAVLNSFRNAGQVCVSTERIYVDEKIAEEFERKVVEKTRVLKFGPGLDEDVQVGPMINARQKEHVARQVADAVSGGARVLHGAQEQHGNFFQPTILTDLPPELDIMRSETFGPVVCITRFRDPEQAVQLANDTPFGLGATVYGSDEAASEVARQLDAGMIGVNKSCGGASGSPWVGAKQSGYGFHSSLAGHRQFAQTRVVSRPR